MHPERAAYRFGEFVFGPASGELKNAGNGSVTVRLQPQVAALLSVLLERPGSVVSRAELQAKLWPDTTVDFDDGINFCVRQLRLALGDDAGQPKFVETLARRGYRFIAPVSVVTEAPAPKVTREIRRNPSLLILIAFVGIVAATLFVNRMMRSDPVPTGAIVAVLPFEVDRSDSTMVAYERQLFDQVSAGVRKPGEWDLVTDTTTATHVLFGGLKRRGVSVEVSVHLVRWPERRHLWADSILDSYAFSGNSTLTADRIARSVTHLLRADTALAGRR